MRIVLGDFCPATAVYVKYGADERTCAVNLLIREAFVCDWSSWLCLIPLPPLTKKTSFSLRSRFPRLLKKCWWPKNNALIENQISRQSYLGALRKNRTPESMYKSFPAAISAETQRRSRRRKKHRLRSQDWLYSRESVVFVLRDLLSAFASGFKPHIVLRVNHSTMPYVRIPEDA